jgi:hypothetical protein
MPALFAAIAAFFTPVVIFFTSVVVIVAFLLGALADPNGFVNGMIVGAINNVSSILPSTPDNLKIGYLIDSVAGSMPLVGRGIINTVLSSVSTLFGVRLVIAIYKLLPFKAT